MKISRIMRAIWQWEDNVVENFLFSLPPLRSILYSCDDMKKTANLGLAVQDRVKRSVRVALPVPEFPRKSHNHPRAEQKDWRIRIGTLSSFPVRSFFRLCEQKVVCTCLLYSLCQEPVRSLDHVQWFQKGLLILKCIVIRYVLCKSRLQFIFFGYKLTQMCAGILHDSQ